MKECSKCKIEKEIIHFNKNSKNENGLASWCKTCMSERSKKYYLDNIDKVKISMTKSKDKIRKWYIEYKSKVKCTKCDFKHTAAIEFHHLDPSKKDFTVGNAINNNKKEDEVRKELEKCIPLCANCHKIFHHLERKDKITIEAYLTK